MSILICTQLTGLQSYSFVKGENGKKTNKQKNLWHSSPGILIKGNLENTPACGCGKITRAVIFPDPEKQKPS